MSRLVITGAGGFLGWHVRVLAHALRLPAPVLAGRAEFADTGQLAALVDGADRVVHLAGANRGTPDEVNDGNITPAESLARALRQCRTPPKSVVFANSAQAGNASPYGTSKATAAHILRDATRWTGSVFTDLRLPNIFGEHGRPRYNSVIATFCRALADRGPLEIHQDRELDLLHATDAAALLLGIGTGEVRPVRRGVRQLAEQLRYFAETYDTGDIPALADQFDVRLFNTFRSHLFPAHYPIALPRHTDGRGELVEAVKVHGGGGQTFWSSTRPGITRGEHYHLSKVERFAVVRGTADIRLRRLLHAEVVTFRVDGAKPVIIDMPTMWAHNITNVGSTDLLTLFWSHDRFDPAHADTYPEPVAA